MEIKDIEYIKAIVDHGSVTKAAEALYITQPSLSLYIKNMHQRLGFEVFVQHGKKFELTYLGEEFLKHGLNILKIKEDFYDIVQNVLDNKSGRLKLAIPRMRSSYLVPVLLSQFKVLYPNVDIHLNEVSSSNFYHLIENGDVDLALMNASLINPNFETEKIKAEEILIALPSEHPVCQNCLKDNSPYPTIDLQCLDKELFILHQRNQFSRHVSEQIFLNNSFQPNKILMTRNIETAINLVANGLGVCFINISHIKYLNVGDKIQLFSLQKKFYVDLIVAYRKQRQLPAFARDFIEICKTSI